MNIQSEINGIQKQLLVRLGVKKGSTMFTIIEALTRQAYATSSFVVRQKNSTLAKKCQVTASTISRNLKKLKEKCADLLTIEQNRNSEEKFAALVFTFKCQTVVSNGCKTEPVKDSNESYELAEIPTNSFTNSLVSNKNHNKDLIHNIVNKVEQEKIINEAYLQYAEEGMSKSLFDKVLSEVVDKKGIINFKAYLYGALKNVNHHKSLRKGTKVFKEERLNVFNDFLNDSFE